MQNRILIPIHNVAGQIVAFCGRWVGEAPAGTPKYVLPAGFRKSLELFNIHRVPEEMREVILVEGYFDVFALHTQGYTSVVAVMGSSLSQRQSDLLAERFNSVKIFFDGNALDQARTAARQLEDRLFVKVIVCPEEKQPEHLNGDELEALIG